MVNGARRAIPVGVLIAVAVACGGGSKIQTQNTPTPTPTVSTHPTQSVAGTYMVNATSCLHIRAQPTVTAQALSCAASGSTVRADGQTRNAEGYTWYHVKFNGVTGWAAGTFLKRAGASPSSTATP